MGTSFHNFFCNFCSQLHGLWHSKVHQKVPLFDTLLWKCFFIHFTWSEFTFDAFCGNRIKNHNESVYCIPHKLDKLIDQRVDGIARYSFFFDFDHYSLQKPHRFLIYSTRLCFVSTNLLVLKNICLHTFLIHNVLLELWRNEFKKLMKCNILARDVTVQPSKKILMKIVREKNLWWNLRKSAE